MDFRVIIAVAIGGAAGSVARYGVVRGVERWSPAFPAGTILVNVVGCLLIGLLYAWLADRAPGPMRQGLSYGVLGGLTTFSAFGLDAFRLFEQQRYAAAAGYAIGSVAAGLACVFIGVAIGRALMGGPGA